MSGSNRAHQVSSFLGAVTILFVLTPNIGCTPWHSAYKRLAQDDLRGRDRCLDLSKPDTPRMVAVMDRDFSGDRQEPREVISSLPTRPVATFQFSSPASAHSLNHTFSQDHPQPEPMPGLLAPQRVAPPKNLEVVRLAPHAEDSAPTPILGEIRLVSHEESTNTTPRLVDDSSHDLESVATTASDNHSENPLADQLNPEGNCSPVSETFIANPARDRPCDSDEDSAQISPAPVYQMLRMALGCTVPFIFRAPLEHRACCAASHVNAICGDRGIVDAATTFTLNQRRDELSATIDGQTGHHDGEAEPSVYGEVANQLLLMLRRHLALLDEQSPVAMPTAERNYWRVQVQTLVKFLESTDPANPSLVPRHVVAETVESLRRAMREIESTANLEIPQAAFCTEVRGFGQYDVVADHVFQCGQPLLIYCELRNYLSQPTMVDDETWYATRLKSKIIVRDPLGRVVQRADYPIVEDLARNQRQDFYLHVPYTVGQLKPGSYRLDLLIDDIQGNKTACYQPGLTFRVR